MMTPIELVAKSWNRKVMSLEDGIIWKRHVDQLLFKDDSTETVSTWEYPSSVTPSEDQSNLEQSTCFFLWTSMLILVQLSQVLSPRLLTLKVIQQFLVILNEYVIHRTDTINIVF